VREPRYQTTAASQRELTDLLVAGARAAFTASPVIDEQRVFVFSSGGFVSLSGTVDAEDGRRLAQETVEKIPGVSGVLNEIIAIPPTRRTASRY
jgi:hypothetical protein